jgi:hypothetical protein
MSDDCDTPHEPPQYGGVRCECGEEVLPYVLTNGALGFHFMDTGDSHDTGTLKAEIMRAIDGWTYRDDGCLDRDGIPHIQEFRAVLAECVDLIDRELAARKFR